MPKHDKKHPFWRAVFRGLGIVMPPLLTLLLFIWAWTMIESNLLGPMESWTRSTSAYIMDWWNDEVPASVFARVKAAPGKLGDVTTAENQLIYERYLQLTWLRRSYIIPVFLCLFLLLLYLLGKFLAAGVGRIIVNAAEGLITRLPLIRNVYSSVKQVTDFVFSEKEIEFNRVVAIEYPRKGIWSLGFVTGESMIAIRAAANQPVVTVLIPTSPMPATGYTITVLRSETIDLNITVDQAIQFIISCGVVVPRPQQYNSEEADRFSAERSGLIETQPDPPNGNGKLKTASPVENDEAATS